MGIAPSSQAPDGIASGCEAHLITTDAHLEELEREWGALFDVAPTASPPLRWEWVREWWRIYGPVYGDRGRGLRLITVRRGPDLIGVLPLYQRTTRVPGGARQLRFISTGEAEFEETCAEYLDVLHVPGAAGECVAAVGRTLTDDRSLPWDQLELSDISVRSPLIGLRELVVARGTWSKLREPKMCYISDLTGGFEAYLKRCLKGPGARLGSCSGRSNGGGWSSSWPRAPTRPTGSLIRWSSSTETVGRQSGNPAAFHRVTPSSTAHWLGSWSLRARPYLPGCPWRGGPTL